MTRNLLLISFLVLALTACGSSGHVIPRSAADSPLETSFAQLRELDLKVRLRFSGGSTFFISSLEGGTVERLSPRAGTRVKKGGVVTIFATGGPLASPAVLKSNPRYRVPSFIGRTAKAALNWADKHRMYWEIPALPTLSSSTAPSLFDAYRVIGQKPAPGGTIGQGHLLGSGGYQVTPLTLSVVAR